MYFWSIEAIANALKSGELTEWQKAKIYILGALVSIASSAIGMLFGGGIDWLSAISWLLSGVALIFCVIWTFNLNQKGDGKNYIERLICFSLPAMVRAEIAYLIFIFIYQNISVNFTIPMLLAIGVYLLLMPAVYFLMFFYIGKGFRLLHS